MYVLPNSEDGAPLVMVDKNHGSLPGLSSLAHSFVLFAGGQEAMLSRCSPTKVMFIQPPANPSVFIHFHACKILYKWL